MKITNSNKMIKSNQLSKNKLLEKSSVIDMEGDEVDEIQGKQLAEVNSQLILRISSRINSIDSALNRIEENSYGVCVDCDDLIAEKRLIFNPCCTTCISCAEEREIEAMQRGKL